MYFLDHPRKYRIPLLLLAGSNKNIPYFSASQHGIAEQVHLMTMEWQVVVHEDEQSQVLVDQNGTVLLDERFCGHLQAMVTEEHCFLSCHGHHWEGSCGNGMWWVHFSTQKNENSLWTFFPQHLFGVHMYYVGMRLTSEAHNPWVYLCFSKDYPRDGDFGCNPRKATVEQRNFYLTVTSDAAKASLFRMSATTPEEYCLSTCTLAHGPLWINHSGAQETETCQRSDIRATAEQDGLWATWTHLGPRSEAFSRFKLSRVAA